jgi:N-acyl-D-aspartate/D-glutamate deacylase
VGHSALRVAVMGLERSLHERATDGELARMRRLAQEALEAGCFGISVDIVHWHKVTGAFAGRSVPSHYADAREYRMLAEVCREYDAVYQVTPDARRPLTSLLVLAMAVGIFRPPLRLTVLAALDMADAPRLWRVFPIVTFVINRLLGGNLRFQTLPEPFAIYADGPVTPLFEEFEAGAALNTCANGAARRSLWQTPGFRDSFRREWESHELRTFHRDPARMTVVASPESGHAGRTIADIARERGQDATDALMDLLEAHDERLRWFACGANERPRIRERLMASPHILPGFSDAGAHSRNLAYFDSALSVLRQAVANGFMAPERAIARVTGEAARWFNVETGLIRTGRRADVALLRPEALRAAIPPAEEFPDPSFDGARRMVKRSGDAVSGVYVAGTEVVRDGVPLPRLGTAATGALLRPTVTARGREAVLARYRNRFDDEHFEHPFTDYWDVFVFKHQRTGNVALHCVGVVLMYGAVAGALATRNPGWLLLAVASQVAGLAGHLLFERSHVDLRDMVFSWRASRCLNRMFLAVLRGRYGSDVGRVRARWAEYEASGGA